MSHPATLEPDGEILGKRCRGRTSRSYGGCSKRCRHRDAAASFALYDAEIEWDTSQGSVGQLLGGKLYRGHEELRDVFRHLYEAWEVFEVRLEEVIDAGGEQVIAIVTGRGRGRSSGVEVEQKDQGSVWTIRDGKVVRVVWFSTRDEALEAVGRRA